MAAVSPTGVPAMKSSQFAADGNGGLQVMWEDGERVFCRGWRQTPTKNSALH